MKKWLIVFVVASIAVIGLSVKAFCMGQAPKSMQITGKVSEVNLKALTVKITPKTGDSLTLQIDEKTALTKGGKNIIISGLKKDDVVTASYQIRWGKKIANLIVVLEQSRVAPKTAPAKGKK